MERRRLGNTLVTLPLVAQGTTRTGPSSSADAERDNQRVAVLRAGIEWGLNFIDCAELYGGGRGEEITARAIAGWRDRVFLASKFNPSNNTSEGVERALDGSLRRLGTDYLDLYQMHWPNPGVPLEGTLEGLTRMVEKAKIRHIGLSNVSLQELEQATRIADIASVQLEYNLTERSIESELLPFCERKGITVLAYSPLDQGRSRRPCPVLQRLSAKYDRTPAQVVLRWVTRSEAVIAVTMTTSPQHMEESSHIGEFSLEAADAQALGDATRVPVEWIEPRAIEVVGAGRPVHLTLEQAQANTEDLIPHPLHLAESIRRHDIVKPVKVVPQRSSGATRRFQIVDDQLRYWAWVIAYGWDKPIPAYVLAEPAAA